MKLGSMDGHWRKGRDGRKGRTEGGGQKGNGGGAEGKTGEVVGEEREETCIVTVQGNENFICTHTETIIFILGIS